MAAAVEKAYEMIREGIVRGAYAQGSHITAQSLAAACGLSRTPVREAMRRLAAEGLIRFIANRGAFVSRWREEEVQQIYELRLLLEGFAAEGAARHATAAQLEELAALAADMSRMVEESGTDERADWLDRIVDWQQYLTDPDEFMLNLKTDLGQGEVFVFTPKGRLVTLPVGATPVDFAYGVHTEVGHRCIGARVNGRLVPLDHVLSSGDTAEIVTANDGHRPSEDWLEFVKSRSAQAKIRQWFRREHREDIVDRGQDELERALRRERLPAELIEGETIDEVATQMGYSGGEALTQAIGEEKVRAATVAGRLVRQLQHSSGQGTPMLATDVLGERRRTKRADGSGVHVEGFREELVRLARCCSPVPPDEIMGFLTRGRGIAVHRTDCTNAVSLSSHTDRVVDVEWEQ